MAIAAAESPGGVSANVLVIALWFGLAAGLVEGLGSLALQSLGWHYGIWIEMVWVSPVFAALLFVSLGMVLVLAHLAYRRLPVLTVAVFLFASLAFFIFLELALPWQVHTGALTLLSAGLGSVITRGFSRYRDPLMRFWRRSLPVVAGLTLLLVAVVQGGFWLLEATA
jgi:hypothetical protein